MSREPIRRSTLMHPICVDVPLSLHGREGYVARCNGRSSRRFTAGGLTCANVVPRHFSHTPVPKARFLGLETVEIERPGQRLLSGRRFDFVDSSAVTGRAHVGALGRYRCRVSWRNRVDSPLASCRAALSRAGGGGWWARGPCTTGRAPPRTSCVG